LVASQQWLVGWFVGQLGFQWLVGRILGELGFLRLVGFLRQLGIARFEWIVGRPSLGSPQRLERQLGFLGQLGFVGRFELLG
jgi:hypothetical protein